MKSRHLHTLVGTIIRRWRCWRFVPSFFIQKIEYFQNIIEKTGRKKSSTPPHPKYCPPPTDLYGPILGIFK